MNRAFAINNDECADGFHATVGNAQTHVERAPAVCVARQNGRIYRAKKFTGTAIKEQAELHAGIYSALTRDADELPHVFALDLCREPINGILLHRHTGFPVVNDRNRALAGGFNFYRIAAMTGNLFINGDLRFRGGFIVTPASRAESPAGRCCTGAIFKAGVMDQRIVLLGRLGNRAGAALDEQDIVNEKLACTFCKYTQ